MEFSSSLVFHTVTILVIPWNSKNVSSAEYSSPQDSVEY